MPRVFFTTRDGKTHEVGCKARVSVMQAALTHNIDGIVGECGGSAMCATCHVYVDESFLDKLELMSEVEDELLESTASPRLPNSRLGCQISLVDALDGLVVKVPERQS
jgi:ferredoxin, 2Fe-2S